MNDPIKNFLDNIGLGSTLKYSAEPVGYSYYYQPSCEGSCADTRVGDDIACILGEHKSVSDPVYYDRHHEYTIHGGECVVIETVIDKTELSSHRRRRGTRVLVRPNADKRRVKRWLEEELSEKGIKRKKARILHKFKQVLKMQAELAEKLRQLGYISDEIYYGFTLEKTKFFMVGDIGFTCNRAGSTISCKRPRRKSFYNYYEYEGGEIRYNCPDREAHGVPVEVWAKKYWATERLADELLKNLNALEQALRKK